MSQKHSPAPATPAATWTSREAYLLALVCLVVGLVAGYVFHGSTAGGASVPLVPPPAPNVSVAQQPVQSPEVLAQLAKPLLAAVKADPNNVDALVQLGNFYFDNRAYGEAISYYTRALELRPNDVNVRTDRGTAYWYSGFPEKAIEDYERSLALDPNHANTLFNMGVVKLHGLQDAEGAVAAWQKLLQAYPQHPERARIETLIAQARSQKP